MARLSMLSLVTRQSVYIVLLSQKAKEQLLTGDELFFNPFISSDTNRIVKQRQLESQIKEMGALCSCIVPSHLQIYINIIYGTAQPSLTDLISRLVI